MGEEIKFTQDELNAIADIQRKFQELTFRFGQLYMEREAIEARMTQNAVDFEKTKQELDGIRTQEKALAKVLQSKYGEGQLNPQTGVFVPVASAPVPQG